MSTDLSTAGKRIRFFRERKGWSQDTLAKAVHSCQASVSLWERDLRWPPKLARQELARELDLDAEYLFAPPEPKPADEVAA